MGSWIMLEAKTEKKILPLLIIQRDIVQHHTPSSLIEKVVQKLNQGFLRIPFSPIRAGNFDVELGRHGIGVPLMKANFTNWLVFGIEYEPVAIRGLSRVYHRRKPTLGLVVGHIKRTAYRFHSFRVAPKPLDKWQVAGHWHSEFDVMTG